MKKCPFCIKNHRHKIYETKTEYVIYNLRPGKNKGRCCVIPKRHVKNIREFSEIEAASLFKTVRLVSLKLAEHLKPVGFNYGLNEGKIAGQSYEHLHFHIIPRYKNDGLSEFHPFHRDPKTKRNLSDRELRPLVEEFRRLFSINTP